MGNINAFIADLKTTWLRKIITDNNSPRSTILQSLTNIKTVLNLETHFIAENKEKTSFGEMYTYLINTNKEYANRNTTMSSQSNFLQ